MNIRFLQTFLTVAEEKSFSGAAKRLHLTQPAVTKHVQTLEKHFQVTLFDRKGWQSELTEAGLVLYGYAQRIVTGFEEAELALKKVGLELQGILRLGASTIPGEYALPLLVGEFTFQYPEVHLQLEIRDSGSIRRMVINNELDLGLVGASSADPQLVYFPFAHDKLVLVVSPQHPWADRYFVEPKELEDVALVWREKDSGTRQVAEAALSEQGVNVEDLKVRMELGSTEAVLNAVVTGMGASIISKHAAERYFKLKRLVEVPIKGLEITRPLYLVYKKEKQLSSVVEAFVRYVKSNTPIPS